MLRATQEDICKPLLRSTEIEYYVITYYEHGFINLTEIHAFYFPGLAMQFS